MEFRNQYSPLWEPFTNALRLQNCLNKVLGRRAFGQRNIACRAPTSIVAVDIGTDNIDVPKNLTRKGTGVSTIHKGDGVTLWSS